MSSFNLSELFESVAVTVPDRVALVSPARTLTYRELDERATRLANHLSGVGVVAGDHVALYLRNGTEYIEGMLAAFKLRAVPINVNYRYVERELVHLFDDADVVAVMFGDEFAENVETIAPSLPKLRYRLSGSDYEAALASASPIGNFTDRSGDDLYIVYTGGTTGMPKGVMWRQEDLFFAALGSGDPLLDKGPITDPAQLPGRVPDFPITQLCTPPFMHVSAHWGAFNTFFGGGKVVILGPGRLDGDEAWKTIAANGINVCTVVGDAMARPLLDAYAAAPEGTYDTSSMFIFASGGAILSASTKTEINRLLPNVAIVDTFGSSETGLAGTRSSAADADGSTSSARFNVDDRTAVLDADLKPVAPGSGEVGRLARKGHVPLGYYKDKEKSAAAFVTFEGQRWVLPGDMASVETDGTIVLLGRGSTSINTGGEKVFPEEVEAVLKGHPSIFDVLVVGAPDERWGERVVAVVSLRPGLALTPDELQEFARSGVAAYKVPRAVIFVDSVKRGENGKPDYRWAKEVAVAELVEA